MTTTTLPALAPMLSDSGEYRPLLICGACGCPARHNATRPPVWWASACCGKERRWGGNACYEAWMQMYKAVSA